MLTVGRKGAWQSGLRRARGGAGWVLPPLDGSAVPLFPRGVRWVRIVRKSFGALRPKSRRGLQHGPIEVIGGDLPLRERRLVEAWAELHQGELMENWRRPQSGQLPYAIAPLR